MTSKGKSKDSDKPSMPLNAYFKYRLKRLNEMDKEDKNRSKKIKIEWDEMSDKEKKKLEDEYYQELEIYRERMEKYEKDHGIKRDKSKSTKRKTDRSARKSGRKDRNESAKKGTSANRDRSASNKRGKNKNR